MVWFNRREEESRGGEQGQERRGKVRRSKVRKGEERNGGAEEMRREEKI